MRAQVTIEYLFLSAVSLSLIAFSVLALVHIRDSTARAHAAVLFKSSAADLANAMDEACALGDGNSRMVTVKQALDIAGGVSGSMFYAEFENKKSNLSLARKTLCPISDASSISGKVKVKNERGSVSAVQYS